MNLLSLGKGEEEGREYRATSNYSLEYLLDTLPKSEYLLIMSKNQCKITHISEIKTNLQTSSGNDGLCDSDQSCF
jgi:hypothetical protein